MYIVGVPIFSSSFLTCTHAKGQHAFAKSVINVGRGTLLEQHVGHVTQVVVGIAVVSFGTQDYLAY
jgi:hypothetical protein